MVGSASSGTRDQGEISVVKDDLSQIACAGSFDRQGVIARLETALDALDRSGSYLASAYVDHALQLLQAEASDSSEGRLDSQ